MPINKMGKRYIKKTKKGMHKMPNGMMMSDAEMKMMMGKPAKKKRKK